MYLLRRFVNGVATMTIVCGKSEIVLNHKESWPIARKNLVATVITAELSKKAFIALGFLDCKQYFWSDSGDVLQWIKNKDLRLDRFISRCIEKIYVLSESEDWRYCPKNLNPANVASHHDGVKKPETRRLLFEGPDFLKQNRENPSCDCVSVSVNRKACSEIKDELCFFEESPINRLIEIVLSLYVLTKRVAYLRAFVDLRCKIEKQNFVRPKWDTCDLNKILNKIVGVVQ